MSRTEFGNELFDELFDDGEPIIPPDIMDHHNNSKRIYAVYPDTEFFTSRALRKFNEILDECENVSKPIEKIKLNEPYICDNEKQLKDYKTLLHYYYYQYYINDIIPDEKFKQLESKLFTHLLKCERDKDGVMYSKWLKEQDDIKSENKIPNLKKRIKEYKALIDEEKDDVKVDDTYISDRFDLDDVPVVNISRLINRYEKILEEFDKICQHTHSKEKIENLSRSVFCKHLKDTENDVNEVNMYITEFKDNYEKGIPYYITAYKYKKVINDFLADARLVYEAEIKKSKEKHNNIVREYNSQHFNCECGGKYYYSNRAGHLRTERHKKYLQNK